MGGGRKRRQKISEDPAQGLKNAEGPETCLRNMDAPLSPALRSSGGWRGSTGSSPDQGTPGSLTRTVVPAPWGGQHA